MYAEKFGIYWKERESEVSFPAVFMWTMQETSRLDFGETQAEVSFNVQFHIIVSVDCDYLISILVLGIASYPIGWLTASSI